MSQRNAERNAVRVAALHTATFKQVLGAGLRFQPSRAACACADHHQKSWFAETGTENERSSTIKTLPAP